jgi:hypothetical protein
MLRTLGPAMAAVLLIGCGASVSGSDVAAPTPDNTATERCLSSQYAQATSNSPSPKLAAVFESDAGTLVHWIETRHGPDGPRPVATLWRAQSASQPVWVCYFDGSTVQPPLPRGGAPYDRFRVFVSTGIDVLDAAGRAATMPLDPPR